MITKSARPRLDYIAVPSRAKTNEEEAKKLHNNNSFAHANGSSSRRSPSFPFHVDFCIPFFMQFL